MNERALKVMLKVLRLLEKYELKGLFFITGSVAEEIGDCPEVLELLEQHEIGYHSSSHSIRPMIFEYTDVENYDEAVGSSLKRETSRIDPCTGDILGEGGILLLRKIFPEKKIESFRAPFLCWTPPHLEALRKLGFRFDFSTGLCQKPSFTKVHYKGITFYPRPLSVDSRISMIGYIDISTNKHSRPNIFLSDILKRDCTVLMKHYAEMVYRVRHAQSKPRRHMDMVSHFLSAELLLLELSLLQDIGLVKITPPLKKANTSLDLNEVNLREVYDMSMWAPHKLFGFTPKFLLCHFRRFFALSK